MLNKPKNQLVIGSLKGRFGLTEVTGDARVYDSAEYLKKIEPEHLQKRGMTEGKRLKKEAQMPRMHRLVTLRRHLKGDDEIWQQKVKD